MSTKAVRLGGSPLVIGLLGPTGVGKTAVGVHLARLLSEWAGPHSPTCTSPASFPSVTPAPSPTTLPVPRTVGAPTPSPSPGSRPSARFSGRLISCDSMQVYRGFPLLTNQPWGDEEWPSGHVLVGFVDPATEFSAIEYAAKARPFIEEDLAARGWALLVGGTGLYMRAALAPLATPAAADLELRVRLEARAADGGPDILHAELARVDPVAARSIDARNVRRVMRALEAVSLSGRAWSGRNDLWAPSYYHPTLLVGLVAPRDELYGRIDARAARVVDGGAVEEVRRFRQERGLAQSRPGSGGVCSAIGYPQICRFLDGEQTREETIRQVAAATRQYARRQLTWLRKLGDAVIIDLHERGPGEVAGEILALAASGEHTKGRHLQ